MEALTDPKVDEDHHGNTEHRERSSVAEQWAEEDAKVNLVGE